MKNKLAIVVPAYNEEKILKQTIQRLLKVISDLQSKISAESYILFVDDGSTDRTWKIIEDANQQDFRIHGLKLSRNFGHQYALWAGLMEVRSQVNMCISIDADLQDDPAVIPQMIDAYQKDGCQIVYGVRNNRDTDTWLKRTTANIFYKIMNLIGANTIPNHADFRLMSSKALDLLAQYPERQLFLRGLIPQLGLKTGKVYYKRLERKAGQSKYTPRKMFNLAWNGITLFSNGLLRIPTILGIIALVIGCILGISKIINVHQFGWNLVSLWFATSAILISLGIVAEYLGKVFTEIKGRPRYLIEERTMHND